jgi:hypothetical protein
MVKWYRTGEGRWLFVRPETYGLGSTVEEVESDFHDPPADDQFELAPNGERFRARDAIGRPLPYRPRS